MSFQKLGFASAFQHGAFWSRRHCSRILYKPGAGWATVCSLQTWHTLPIVPQSRYFKKSQHRNLCAFCAILRYALCFQSLHNLWPLKKKVFYRQSVLKRKLDSIHVNFDQPCGFPAQRLSDPRGSTSTLQPWTICGCCIIGNDSGMKRSVTGGPAEHSQLFILDSGFILVCTIVYVVTTATILSAVT